VLGRAQLSVTVGGGGKRNGAGFPDGGVGCFGANDGGGGGGRTQVHWTTNGTATPIAIAGGGGGAGGAADNYAGMSLQT